MDLTTLTDDELEQHRIDVLTERERRDALATIPGQVSDLAAKYRAGGGDPAELRAALEEGQHDA